MEQSLFKSMGRREYLAWLAFFSTLMVGVSASASYLTLGWSPSPGITIISAVGVLIISLVGSAISKASPNWIVSLGGSFLVTIPFGLLLGPAYKGLSGTDIFTAYLITTLVVAVLGLVGVIYPRSLEDWTGYILAGLLLSIAGYLILPLMAGLGMFPIKAGLGVWDWAVVALFCFIVVYDFNQAVRKSFTMDNAVDSALDIYLDYINILIRMFGSSRD